MKITLKTLQGKQLPMEIEADSTIEALKAAIAAQHDMPAESQNLVAYGKVLADGAKSVTDYGIKDGDFIVVMVKKAKPAAKPKPAPVVEQPKPVEPVSVEQATSGSGGANVEPAQVQPANPNPQPVQPAQPEFVANAEDVATLVAITGKDAELCSKALQAAFGDPDRAFSYITDGIPQNLAQPSGNAGGGPAAQQDPAAYGEGGEGADNGLAAMQAMASNPNFPQLRARILQNPQFYQEFMTMLQSTQPEMHAAIEANPQAFMQLIIGGQVGAGAGPGAAGGRQPPPPGSISVTQEEMESIQRLEQLGFTRNRCVQAFFACDKNEEYAANFLFEAGADDDDDALNQGMAASQGLPPPNQNPPAQVNPAQANPEPAATTTDNVENKPAEEKPAEPKPEEGAGAGEAQQDPQPEANNNNGGNGDNEPDAGAGAGGEAPEKSAFE